MRNNPESYFVKKFPNEDPWIRLARIYVVKHQIDKAKALKLAREAVKRRDELTKKRDTNSDLMDAKIEKIKTDYLIRGLKQMVKKNKRKSPSRTHRD